MLIRSLHLENFKCFKNFDAEFSEGVNLIIGTNGVGKTSILEGLSFAAGSLWIQLSEINKRGIERDEIRVEPKLDRPQKQFPVVVKATGDVLKDTNIEWSRELNTISGGPTQTNARQLVELSKEVASIIQDGRKEILPLIAYFSASRLAKGRKLPKTDKDPTGRYLGYYNALNDTNIQKYIEKWFGDQSLKAFHGSQIGQVVYDDGVELLKNIIKSLPLDKVNAYFYNPNLGDTQSDDPSGLYLTGSDGSILHESQLSDGYRNLLWLMVEIAWRAYNLNHFLGKNAAKETNGIVLIDEIDLHLHPSLQQKVIDILEEAFPKVQFIITTHSPIVVSSAKRVLILNNNKLELAIPTFGKESSLVQQELMGVGKRLPESQAKFDHYFTLINQGNGKNKEALELRIQLETETPDDPAFARADVMIDLFN